MAIAPYRPDRPASIADWLRCGRYVICRWEFEAIMGVGGSLAEQDRTLPAGG